jgi:hypothetical protein
VLSTVVPQPTVSLAPKAVHPTESPGSVSRPAANASLVNAAASTTITSPAPVTSAVLTSTGTLPPVAQNIPTDPVQPGLTESAATEAKSNELVQHRPLHFLSSVLMSSRRRQLVTFSIAVMAMLLLFRAPDDPVGGSSDDTHDSGRTSLPRRVADQGEEVAESEWAAGVPAPATRPQESPAAAPARASWQYDSAYSGQDSIGPTAPASNPDGRDSHSHHAARAESAVETWDDGNGEQYPRTDPATYQYPPNAHELIISMLARERDGN